MSWKNGGIDHSMDIDIDRPDTDGSMDWIHEGFRDYIEKTHVGTAPDKMSGMTKLEAKLKLRGLRYDVDKQTIEIKDEKGRTRTIKLYIYDIRAMQKRMKEIDDELKKEGITKRETKKLIDEKKILRENIAYIRSNGPHQNGNVVSISSEHLSHMSREDIEGLLTHEGEHYIQSTREQGANSEIPGYMLVDNAELQFIKDYIKSENGKKLDKNHDAWLIEMTADAAAVKRMGAEKYGKSLKKTLDTMLSYDNIVDHIRAKATELNGAFNRAQEIMDQVEANDSDTLSDTEMIEIFKKTSSAYDNFINAIFEMRIMVEDSTIYGVKYKFFDYVKAFIKAFKTPDKYFNKKVCKELIKNLTPRERKEALRYIFNKQSKELIGDIMGEISDGTFNKQWEAMYDANIESLKIRIQFCKDFEKWYKHEYKKTVVEFLELSMEDMGICCEAYLADHFADSLFRETHTLEEDDDVVEEEVIGNPGTEPPARKPGEPAQPHPVQEAPGITGLTGGFSNLCFRLKQKLEELFGDTYTVSQPVVMGTHQFFTITGPETTTTVDALTNGCRVVTRNKETFDATFNFANVPISQAFDQILNLFKNPKLLTEGATIDPTTFGRFYMEDGEGENEEDLDTLLNNMESDGADRESPQDDNEEDADKNEPAEMSEETEIDITSFGTDTSDVQNQFDPKEIETLNKLIAAESEAINDYFDASKDSHDENLMRLYSDIGHEERFHLEQLMYAKSTLTGEKYEPRDPEVKKEYEELLAIGMDDDTAASTAIDKVTMKPEKDMEELTEESAFLFNSLFQNEMIMEACYKSSVDKEDNILMEAFFMEEMSNLASAPKEVRKMRSPVKVLIKGLKVSINGILRLGNIIRDSATRSKYGIYQMHQWIKKHGISELFAGGISLYFYNDKISRYDFETPEKYIDMLYNLTRMIAKETGIHLTQEAKRAGVKDPIRFGNVVEGMDKLRQVTLIKTKVVVTDNNKDMLAREFFGYSPEKLKVQVKTEEGDINQSYNIYNRLSLMQTITADYMKISLAVLEALDRMEGDTNTIFYKDRNKYNKAVKNMKIIVQRYNEYIRCMAYDTNQILKLNNGLKDITQKHDTADAKGEKYEGKDIRTKNELGSPTQYKFTNR